jgi:hypothetical protein
MLAGRLFPWIGVPFGWLWIGSQVQGSASLGTAMLVTMLGITDDLRRGDRALVAQPSPRGAPGAPQSPRGGNALEMLLVASAGIAIVGFGVWFFGFAGASPVPLKIGF